MVVDLELNDLNEKGLEIMMNKPSYVYLIVSPVQPQGHVDYSFQITTTHVNG